MTRRPRRIAAAGASAPITFHEATAPARAPVALRVAHADVQRRDAPHVVRVVQHEDLVLVTVGAEHQSARRVAVRAREQLEHRLLRHHGAVVEQVGQLRQRLLPFGRVRGDELVAQACRAGTARARPASSAGRARPRPPRPSPCPRAGTSAAMTSFELLAWPPAAANASALCRVLDPNVAALRDRAVEQPARGRRDGQRDHVARARRLAEDRHVPGIAAEAAMCCCTQRSAAI